MPTVSAPRTGTPRVEVMVPYYRGAEYLAAAVASVMALPGDRWRLTVVDDDGPDRDAASVLRRVVGGSDDRVRLVRNRARLGVAGSFNRCLELASEEYVCLMGSDDVMHPNYVDVVTRALGRNPEAVAVQPGVRVIDAMGAPCLPLADRVKRRLRPSGHRLLGGEKFACSLLVGDWLYFPSLTWRTDMVRPFSFDPDLSTAMDLHLILDLISRGHVFVLDPTECFSYRRHASSESSQTAANGGRFDEEHGLYVHWARQFGDMGWKSAAKCSARHVTSRIHALTLAAKARNVNQLVAAIHHTTRPTR